jgi:hypothetical protein
VKLKVGKCGLNYSMKKQKKVHTDKATININIFFTGIRNSSISRPATCAEWVDIRSTLPFAIRQNHSKFVALLRPHITCVSQLKPAYKKNESLSLPRVKVGVPQVRRSGGNLG